MQNVPKGLAAALGAATLAAGLLGVPAAAQLEPALPGTEDTDAVDIAVTPDGSGWWVAETDGQVATAPHVEHP